MLSQRQQEVLASVVDAHLESGRPVGSRAIAERPELEWSPSTIRAELAALEQAGYLTHPHTSAGRMPTDSGYRIYFDALLAESHPQRPGGVRPEVSRMRSEVEAAIRETTAELSRINDLLAVVTAPPIESAHIHRVEVLLPQPRVVTVVVIASTGEVSKRTLTFAEPVDPGIAAWASSYLNERLFGLAVGARMISGRLSDPELSNSEAAFLTKLSPALCDPGEAVDHVLYLDGAARLLSEDHTPEIPRAEQLLDALERRVNLLGVLRSALDERSVFGWIGEENPQPELRGVSVIGANYGLGHRNLGSVGVMGPLRMDYATAIDSVREAASELSRFFETVYED
ncbi:MAG: heat-inducible transcriptional repressor HrcA [Solirubrobacterales bacterium]